MNATKLRNLRSIGGSAKKLQEKASTLYDVKVVIYKGNMMDGRNRYGWIMRVFGQNEIFLGRNLKEAHETIDLKIEFRAE